MKQIIISKLTQSCSPAFLDVVDESHLHKGHMGSRPEGETHFRIIIKSDIFKNKKSLDCHKMIYEFLREEMKSKIHALAIKIEK
jgi:BolA family transcriptional regulator, general stress-responsive regulator